MKKQLFFLAAAALALASCSSENDVVQSTAAQQTTTDEVAVGFDVYMQRTTTRAGVSGAVTTNDLKSTSTDLGKAGFGVFGYYTNSSTYDQQAIPNFFYNQQVYCEDGTNFKYEPVKYWPNEFGTTANSDDADKVTYFAYAPWVSVNPNTGKPDGETDADKLSDLQKWGINSMTTNSTAGDPLIKYIASFDQAKSVDLCWGVCDETNWQKIQDGKSQTFTLGMPWENVERPANTNQKLKFTFKHATAQLKVNIDAFVDGITNAASIDSKTKVYVRAITFEGLATKGSLNLNNKEAKPNKAYWMDYNGVNDLPMGETVTIYDGRKDGKEGTLSGEATNEKSLGLNPNLVQSTLWSDASAKPGVTNVPQPLFCNSDAPATEPIYVIPTGDPVKVTITYDIETADKNLSTYVSDAEQHGSSIENVIWKNITFGKDADGKDINTFENGKSYTLNLHLGMNSVKFDAAVTDWVPKAANDVDLPANVPVYQATSATSTNSITVSSAAETYDFAISGLKAEQSVTGSKATATPDNIATFTTSTTANASGIAMVQVKLNENMTVNEIQNPAITWSDGTNKAQLTITQRPHALGLSVSDVNYINKQITLQTEATVTWATDIVNIDVKRNGITLSNVTGGSLENVNEFTFESGKITLNKEPELGDVYTITLKAGQAPGETKTASIGGIGYASSTLTKDADIKFTNPLITYGKVTITEYTSTTPGIATVDDEGEVTTITNGTTTITATASATNGDGWFYPSKCKTAPYTLIVKKQAATISFENATKAITLTATGSSVPAQKATLEGSYDNILNPSADNGTIQYSIVNGNEIGKFFVDETSGSVKISGGADSSYNGAYTLTIKATVTDGTAYTYAVKEATYKLLVTVAIPTTTP